MKLITEEVSNVKIITEGKGSSKKLYIEGVFLQGNIKNRNGRMYPVETQGGTVVGSFTLMRSESVLLEKQSGHFVFAANAAVKGSKVGYTN